MIRVTLKGRRGGDQVQQPKKGRSKMVGFYREEQPRPLGLKVQGRVLGWGMEARRGLKHVETEECWENLVVSDM